MKQCEDRLQELAQLKQDVEDERRVRIQLVASKDETIQMLKDEKGALEK